MINAKNIPKDVLRAYCEDGRGHEIKDLYGIGDLGWRQAYNAIGIGIEHYDRAGRERLQDERQLAQMNLDYRLSKLRKTSCAGCLNFARGACAIGEVPIKRGGSCREYSKAKD